MTEAELRAKVHELMASGELPNEPPVIHQAGDGLQIGGKKRSLHETAHCLICQQPGPSVTYFWTGGRMAMLHAACDAVWKRQQMETQ
jgi:hypothetical protein